MLHWKIEEKDLYLAYNWKLSRNETTLKKNFFVSVSDGLHTGVGETAPNIRYNETASIVQEQFTQWTQNNSIFSIKNLDELSSLLNEHIICNSLRFGIESAYVHYLCAKTKIKVFNFFNLPNPGKVETCYTIPIMEPGEIKKFYQNNKLARFKSIKVKIDSISGFEMIKELSTLTQNSLKIDANEAWKDVEDLLRFFESIKRFNIDFIEQPLPYNFKEEYFYLKEKSKFELIADESITNEPDFSILAKQFHGVNMKLMKAGGYKKGIEILTKAKEIGLKTMIGCMIETTLGISSGINLCSLTDYADLDGFFIIENEPFNLIKEDKGILESLI